MSTKTLKLLCLPAIAVLMTACGQEASEPTVSDSAADAPLAAPAAVVPAAPVPTPAPAGARVFFITPTDGDTVASPVTIEFGIEGMQVARAGDNTPNSGHHHLLVDTYLPNLAQPVPADANHIHFGDASTSTELTLAPGEHSLKLLLGDYLHIPHDPPIMSETITITVE
jgi:hypothetical protein